MKGVCMKQSFINTATIALWVALIATGTFIVIPVPGSPVPIVLQNMLAVMAGMILGPIAGGASVLLFLVAGALGLPVFSGARGGLAILAGPTGGYLFGYLGGAILAGLIVKKPQSENSCPYWKCALAVLAGMVFIYIPGLIRLSLIFNGDWVKTLTVGCFPYLIGDGIKAVLVTLITPSIRKFYVSLLQS